MRRRARPEPQPELFEPQYRRPYREPPKFYAAVLFLRRIRHWRVYRVSGRQSRINNRLVSNRQLMKIAEPLIDLFCESSTG